MAKGGNNQKSNGSRFTKSHNASNSFVTKVASRVSDYLNGWFGSPLKSSSDASTTETTPPRLSGNTTEKLVFDNVESTRSRSSLLSHRVFDDMETLNLPAKRFKVSNKDRVEIDFPISPIPSTSGLFQSPVNHTFDVPKSENFEASVPGPSDPRAEKFGDTSEAVPQTPSATDMKANGGADNHSDSSESTSGCSSLVPQSDRLSQSVYVCSTRKRNLEEKLKYARHLQQSRASSYLNRSIPVTDVPGGSKKPSFVVTAYGRPVLDKSLLREKLINSPFYNGQTSYGGASAHRLSRNAFYSQRNPRTLTERGEGLQMQVKPSHHGSTEDLSNMSHTAKKILEALEQFSTPVNDAKRIPVSRSNIPLGMKRRRFDELSETRLSTPTSSMNPNPNSGPVITGLNVPTVPDLLKLKRLERIQNSTAAARQVAIQKQEYSLPSDSPPEKRIGKIVTKLKNKEKSVPLEKLEEVNLPKIPLPISTLPKFDFQLPPVSQLSERKTDKQEKSKSRKFVFSPPIAICVNESPEQPVLKNNFTFSKPLNPDENKGVQEKATPSLMNFMSSDAVAKLKRKSIGDSSHKSAVSPVPTQLKSGSIIDFLTKSTDEKAATLKLASGTWECNTCLIRNINDSKLCRGCKAKKLPEEKPRTFPNHSNMNSPAESKPAPTSGFGDKFKPPPGSWSCKECFVSNNASATKCIACESPKPSGTSDKVVPKQEPIKSAQNGFGDKFKPPPGSWSCKECFVSNNASATKCIACESPKPSGTSDKVVPKQEPTKSAQNGFGDKFKPPPGSWSCKECFVSNNASATKCIACESPKPSGTSDKVVPKQEPTKSAQNGFGDIFKNQAVSSSTTDFVFGQNKSTTVPLSIGDIAPNKPPETFQFKPFVSQEAVNTNLNLGPFAEEKKNESVSIISGSGSITTSSQPLTPSIPVFSTSKPAFESPSTTSVGSGFVSTSNTSLFGAPSPSFSTSNFNSQTSAAPSTNSFGIMPQSSEKPIFTTGIAFGSTSVSLSNPQNTFGSTIPAIQNAEPTKTFGSFGANISSIPSFGNNSTPSPAFGSGLIQSSADSEKSSVTNSFIFGVSPPVTTSDPAKTVTVPGIFTFGATNSETKPSFSFGQSSTPSFSFGSNTPATNVFGGYGQSKPENSLGTATSPFGITTPNIFGQSSTPATFEFAAPKFEFGNSGMQQQDAAPSVFRFSATPAQLSSAPIGTSFRLPVPQNFNFTRGQTTVFSPGTESTSSIRGRSREMRKAVRRTNRDSTRRPQ